MSADTQLVKPKSSSPRLDWIDYAKGLAALLVVLIHVSASAINSSMAGTEGYTNIVKMISYYSPNMMVFFIVAGMFVHRSFGKPFSEFTMDRVRLLVYPYFLWSFITFMGAALVPQTNADFTMSDIVRLLYMPIFQYWFLYTMFIIMMLFMGLMQFKVKPVQFLGLAIVMFIIYHSTTMEYNAGQVIPTTFFLALFFAVGVNFNQQIRNFLTNAKTPVFVMMLLVFGGTWLIILAAGYKTEYLWLQTIGRITGLLGLFGLAALFGRLNIAQPVKYWGAHSLQIYLVHWMSLVAFRIIAVRILGLDNPVLYIAGSIIAGIYIPLTLYWFTNKIGFKYAFSFPKPTAKASQKNLPEGQTQAA